MITVKVNAALELALSILSGRLHPGNVSDEQLILLGLANKDEEPDVANNDEILEYAERVVFQAIQIVEPS